VKITFEVRHRRRPELAAAAARPLRCQRGGLDRQRRAPRFALVVVQVLEVDALHRIGRAGVVAEQGRHGDVARLQVAGVAVRVLHQLGVDVHLGFARIVALYHRSSTPYQVFFHIRYLYF
jgi:hypothetical protein